MKKKGGKENKCYPNHITLLFVVNGLPYYSQQVRRRTRKKIPKNTPIVLSISLSLSRDLSLRVLIK
jgi:hypothetical protein